MSVKPWREGVRALVVDPAGRTILVQFVDGVWATPGGGLEPGETHEHGLRRELAEELGLDGVEIGPCIWTREHELDMTAHRGQREWIYLVHVPAFEPAPRLDLAAENVVDVRWWTLSELEASDAVTAPRRLRQLWRALLGDGPPATPVDVGV